MTRIQATIWAIAALLIAATPIFASNFYTSLLNYIGINALVALGLVLLTGAGGLISFGQAAFVGLGAYSTAVASTAFHLSPWLGLPLSLASAAIAAVILGLVTLRLSGHYLALLTIAWGMAIYLVFGNIEALGGHSGLNDVPPLSIGSFRLESNQRYYYLVWAAVTLSMLSSNLLLKSRQGRAIRALRGGAALVHSLGINAFRTRLAVFVLAALLSGLAGWLYAHLQRYVSPTPFDVSVGIEFLLMAVVGGAGWVGGALVGAAIITSLRSVLQDILPLLTSRPGNLEIIVYGCLFILLLQHARGGIGGVILNWLPRQQVKPPNHKSMLQRRRLPTRGAVLLKVEGLTKRFGGLAAVDNVSFTVHAGEVVGLIGPNGAGKSTTFNLISGVLRPTSGRVEFDGKDLATIAPHRLSDCGLSRTFQHVKLRPNMTLLENVMLGAYPRTRSGFVAGALRLDRAEEHNVIAEAMHELNRVGLADKFDELAGGLPLGQQRALEVARALAADPALLMLDEPAAGLRRFEREHLSALLTSLRAEGITLLLVEHDMSFVMGLVDRIVMLDFGKKLAEGKPAEIRGNRSVQKAYLGGVA